MATKIRLRRRTNSKENTGVVLTAGEPYYNTASKRLYIGNKDGEEILESKKHIAEITPLNTSNDDNLIKFQIGEDENNIFEQHVNSVENAGMAESLYNLDCDASGNHIKFKFGPNHKYGFDVTIGGELSGSIEEAKNVTDTIAGVPIESILTDSGQAKSALSAKYADDNDTITIAQRFSSVDQKIADALISANGTTSNSVSELVSRIDKIERGETTVGTAAYSRSTETAKTAQSADALKNFTDKSNGSTVAFSFGPENQYQFSHTLTGQIEGAVTSASNVTEKIDNVPLQDIFLEDGKTVKKADESRYSKFAEYAIDDSEHSIATRFSELTKGVTSYQDGSKVAKYAEYAVNDNSGKSISARFSEIVAGLAALTTAVNSIQEGASNNVAELRNAISDILDGTTPVGDLSNLQITADGTTLTLSWGEDKSSSATVTVELGGSVDSADKLTNSRKITLKGDVTGSVSFDGSKDVEVTTTVITDSHTHTVNTIEGLQTTLDNKSSITHTHSELEWKTFD